MPSLAEIAEREVISKGIILFDSSVIGLEDFLELYFDNGKNGYEIMHKNRKLRM